MVTPTADSGPDGSSPDRADRLFGRGALLLKGAGFVLLWNSGFIGAEYVLPNVGPLTLLFWRYWALCAVLAVYLTCRKRFFWPGGHVVAHAFMLGILAHGTWLGCVIYALLLGVPAGLVALVVALQPLLTGALSGLVTGEPTPRLRWMGTLIGFAGVLITVGARVEFGQPSSVLAYLLPFGSVVAITLASLLERREIKVREPRRVSLGLSLFYQALGVALAVTLPALLFEDLQTKADIPFVLAMLWLVVGVSLGAYWLMWRLVAQLDATRVASLFYLGPPVTMVMAWMAFGDTITAWDLLGLFIVAVGVGLANLRR